jgi:hypothetical protein
MACAVPVVRPLPYIERRQIAVAAQRVDRSENVSGPDLKPRMLVETAIGTKRTNWADAMTSAVGGRAAFAFQGREGSF